MDEAPLGLIEICLAFGLILAAAGFELMRTRRGLARLRRDAAASPPDGRPPA